VTEPADRHRIIAVGADGNRLALNRFDPASAPARQVAVVRDPEDRGTSS
jgi:hypothetical protein